MFKTNQPKETMKPIKIEYHFKDKSFSSFISPKYFETDDVKTAIEICENGKNHNAIVLVNGNKYKAMNTFGKTINLNDA